MPHGEARYLGVSQRWLPRYRCNAQPATRSLGQYTALPPAATRDRAAAHRCQVEQRPALPRCFRRLAAANLYQPTLIALHLLALILVRLRELRAARRAGFDLAHIPWRIPNERMKLRQPHIVPLSSQALAWLAAL
jgi:integrase